MRVYFLIDEIVEWRDDARGDEHREQTGTRSVNSCIREMHRRPYLGYGADARYVTRACTPLFETSFSPLFETRPEDRRCHL